MRTTDKPESFAPLGKAIPTPAPPAPAPAVDGKFIHHPDGTVATNIPKPPAPPYTLQGMWGRDQKASPAKAEHPKVQALVDAGLIPPRMEGLHSNFTELKWIGEAADAWRGIHAQQAADMHKIMGQFNSMAGQMNAEWDRNMGRINLRNVYREAVSIVEQLEPRDMGRKADRD